MSSTSWSSIFLSCCCIRSPGARSLTPFMYIYGCCCCSCCSCWCCCCRRRNGCCRCRGWFRCYWSEKERFNNGMLARVIAIKQRTYRLFTKESLESLAKMLSELENSLLSAFVLNKMLKHNNNNNIFY